MMFYDYHIHPEIDLGGMLKNLETLGWSGVCFVCESLERIEELKKNLGKTKLDVSFGYKIQTEKPNNIPKIAKKIRKKVEMILVFGGDPEINRKACETSEVDILTHPEKGEDQGLDHVMAKLAKKNGVSIEFNFREFLHTYKKSRANLFSKMLANAKLVKKFRSPFILTSGALDPWDVRSPSELISFGRILGLNPKDVKLSLNGEMIRENRKRLGKKWVMPGVELV
jgi:ribonuclease P/MRP protein subunit RPP1